MPVGTLVLVQEAARELGADADALLRSVGVDPSALRFPMTPIPLRVAGRALLRARQVTGSVEQNKSVTKVSINVSI